MVRVSDYIVYREKQNYQLSQLASPNNRDEEKCLSLFPKNTTSLT